MTDANANAYTKLPLDKHGVPIQPGETLIYNEGGPAQRNVTAYQLILSENGWILRDSTGWDYTPKTLSH